MFKRDNEFQSLSYHDITRYHWMSDSPELRGDNHLKRHHYDRLIFEMAGGEKVTIEGLEQAVFSLMKFLRWLSWSEKKAMETPEQTYRS